MIRPTLAILAAVLLVGCAADYSDNRGAPGSDRRIALDTLDRIDVHCFGHGKRARCHNHLDGVPPPSVYRYSRR